MSQNQVTREECEQRLLDILEHRAALGSGIDTYEQERLARAHLQLLDQIQRERENADRLAGELKDRKCTCNGTGLQHKPGYTHYETDAGKECPAYHYGPCPRCELARAALAQHAALRSERDDH